MHLSFVLVPLALACKLLSRARRSEVPVHRSFRAWVLVLALPSVASAFTHDERVDGDLSGDRLNPTTLAAEIGSNAFSGTTVASDVDYVRISLPPGAELSELVLLSIASTDNVAFIAVQEGPTFTVSPDEAVEGDLLGYTHFGTGALAGTATPGNDILPKMSVAPEAIGFDIPLTGSDYTFWIQQVNAQPFGYSFEVFVVPEPGASSMMATGLLTLLVLARRHTRT
jgi:hypothetical protein